jgi:hypothetical protein
MPKMDEGSLCPIRFGKSATMEIFVLTDEENPDIPPWGIILLS